MSFEELAVAISEMGMDGIEATIRPGGQIEPDEVGDKLPELVEALRSQKLDITVMASHITRPDDPLMKKVLETAAKLKIPRYRMGYYRYDRIVDVRKTLKECRSMIVDLAQLNAELGIQAVYQNHAGRGMVGASIWDIVSVMDGVDPAHVGLAFDIRHAFAEGAYSWAADWSQALPHVQSVFVKDFRWEANKLVNVPLGSGLVPMSEFFQMVATSLPMDVPVSLHVEYLEKESAEANLNAIRTDYEKLKSYKLG
jgi:sugar phosphate isomerase/epimerase